MPLGAIREPTVKPPVASGSAARRRLAVLLLLLPVLIGLGAVLGRNLKARLPGCIPLSGWPSIYARMKRGKRPRPTGK